MLGALSRISVRSFSSVPPSLRVAIVGTGPAGFYTADGLLKKLDNVHIDFIEKLPTPYGLVRSGVAPDHEDMKIVINTFSKILESDQVSLFGNLEVGKDVSVKELRDNYHAVVFATGTSEENSLGVPGEDLEGVWPAASFVNWYNGHPDFHDLKFDFNTEDAVVVGQGNVALDVARILAAPIRHLEKTDICAHALDALKNSQIKRVHVIGRRGPAQAAFTTKEFREQTTIPEMASVIRPEDVEFDDELEAVVQADRPRKRLIELLRKVSKQPNTGEKSMIFRFLRGPKEFMAENGSLAAVKLAVNKLGGPMEKPWAEKTDEEEIIKAGLVLTSIGYRGSVIEGLPFNEKKAVLANVKGTVLKPEEDKAGVYAAGWIKRGANGIIATNKPCADETVGQIVGHASEGMLPHKAMNGVEALPESHNWKIVDYGRWKAIDNAEVAAGKEAKCSHEDNKGKTKPREKFVTFPSLLSAAGL